MSKFCEGQHVRYVPSHAVAILGKEDAWEHPDCENGVVNSVRGNMVFVTFRNKDHSWQNNPKGCYPRDLIDWGDGLTEEANEA